MWQIALVWDKHINQQTVAQATRVFSPLTPRGPIHTIAQCVADTSGAVVADSVSDWFLVIGHSMRSGTMTESRAGARFFFLKNGCFYLPRLQIDRPPPPGRRLTPPPRGNGVDCLGFKMCGK